MKFLFTLVAGAIGLMLFQNVDGDSMGTAFQFMQAMGVEDPWVIFQRTGGMALLAGGVFGVKGAMKLQNTLVSEDLGEQSPRGKTSGDQDNQLITRYAFSTIGAIAGLITTLSY